jgi:hypothetical protein
LFGRPTQAHLDRPSDCPFTVDPAPVTAVLLLHPHLHPLPKSATSVRFLPVSLVRSRSVRPNRRHLLIVTCSTIPKLNQFKVPFSVPNTKMPTVAVRLLLLLTLSSVICVCQAGHPDNDQLDTNRFQNAFSDEPSKPIDLTQLIRNSVQRLNPYANVSRNSLESARTFRNSFGLSSKGISMIQLIRLE